MGGTLLHLVQGALGQRQGALPRTQRRFSLARHQMHLSEGNLRVNLVMLVSGAPCGDGHCLLN